MSRHWTVEERKRNFEFCARILKGLGRTDLKTAKAVLMRNSGLREKKIQEYLEVMEASNEIKIEGGEIEYIIR